MENISLVDVFTPQSPWDYYLYVIMFFQFILLISLFVTDNLRDTLMIAAVVICAFMDKAYLFGYLECGRSTLAAAVSDHSKYAFGTIAVRIVMFAFPLVIVTQTKVKIAKPLSIIVAGMSMIYIGGRWFMEQRQGGFTSKGTCFTREGMLDDTVLTYASAIGLCFWYGMRRSFTSSKQISLPIDS